jgi:hypothetical protein
MIAFLDKRFEVCGVVKPGSLTESVSGIMKEEVSNLTTNDFLIISSGTNDINRNELRTAFRNIANFIENVNHTNIILIGAHFRYDSRGHSHSYFNNLTTFFNSKLCKLVKAFSHVTINEMINDRLFYTRYGSHLNEIGKEVLSNQLVMHIFSRLERDIKKPIILGWHEKEVQAIAPSKTEPSQAKLVTQLIPKRNRKVPVIRNNDFLWEI